MPQKALTLAKPPVRPRSHIRESVIILLIMSMAVVVIAGGVIFAKVVPLPAKWFAFGQPTPTASLSSGAAMQQIRAIYPHVSLSLDNPLPDEVDLVSTQISRTTAVTLTTEQSTEILELFIRSHQGQHFWRWVNRDLVNQQIITYEVYSSELWVITTDAANCSTNWLIYAVTPQQIINHGLAHEGYNSNAASRTGTGVAPTNPYNACSATSGQ